MGHIRISRPHHPGAVNIEKLMVDDVLAQKLLSRASLEVLQIHASRSKLDRPSPDVRHVGDMDERTTGPDPDHQSRHLRVDTAIPTNDHVDQTPTSWDSRSRTGARIRPATETKDEFTDWRTSIPRLLKRRRPSRASEGSKSA